MNIPKVHSRLSESVSVAFFLVIIIHLFPLWSYKNFATQDGPSHLHNSAVMLDLYTSASPIFKQYYDMQFTFAGNLLSQITLMGMLSVTSALLAHKIFLSLYVVLFCFGFWYAVSSVRTDSKWIAFLIFPFVYSSWLHLGFYNFVLGMALFFFVIGRFLRSRDDVSLRRGIVLSLWFIVLFFTHLTAFVAALATVLVVATGSVLIQWKNQRTTKAKALVVPLIAFVPAALLLWRFLSYFIVRVPAIEDLSLAAWRVYSIAPIVSGSDVEYLFAKMLAALIGVLVILALYSRWNNRQFHPLDALLAVALLFLVLSIAGPDGAGGGGLIRLRLVSYFFFALILWISAQPIPKTITKIVGILAVGISVLFFISRAPCYAELDRQIEEYLSADPYIEPNTTLLALSYAGHGYDPTPGRRLVKVYLPFEHISGLLAADKPVVDLSNYEASIEVFWTRYRPTLDPFEFVDPVRSSDMRASAANLFGYSPESGGRIDYVLFWGLDERAQRVMPPSRLRNQLSEAYDLIYLSPGRHLVQLYRRKEFRTESEGKTHIRKSASE